MQCDSLDDEIKKIQENPSVGSKLFQADRETDRQKEKQALTKLVVAFRNFAKAPKTTKVVYNSVSQRLWYRGPVSTDLLVSPFPIFFLSSYIKLI